MALTLLLWTVVAAVSATTTVAMRYLKGRCALALLPLLVAITLITWLTLGTAWALLPALMGTACLAASRLAVAGSSGRRGASGAVCLGLLPGLICFAYLGATLPQATWFGYTISHGPRSSNKVALTFDDGPNGDATLAIMRELDAAGVKGTFFQVGRAAEAQPDVTQVLISHGHLIGNHSYSHTRWGWLQPGYPEAAKSQAAIEAVTGLCPAFFRPPHGDRTPFTVKAARNEGLATVTWDVAAADWSTDDAALVANRILDDVRPGSIILLHDGLDGRLGQDRSVVARALPLILKGLKAQGLEPVRLDELLNMKGYQPSANCRSRG